MAFRLFSWAPVRQAGSLSLSAQRPLGIAAQDIVNPLNRAEERGEKFEFLELPIDLLLEIFSHMEPADLLHLSRVSKDLLRLLKSDDSIYIWTSVCFFMSVTNRKSVYFPGICKYLPVCPTTKMPGRCEYHSLYQFSIRCTLSGMVPSILFDLKM